MLQDNFLEVYDKFKLEFFRRIFELVREREGFRQWRRFLLR